MPEIWTTSPRRISERTRAALAAYQAAANAAYADLAPLVAALRAEGLFLWQSAERLNQDGHITRSGLEPGSGREGPGAGRGLVG
jgi:hypothetical protein